MGLSSKKRTEKTNQQTTMTTNPINPGFVTTGIEGLADQIKNTFAGFDSSKLANGPTALQNLASDGAMNLRLTPGQSPGAYGESMGIARDVAGAGPQSVQAASLLENLGAYMNPFREEVRDTALADYDFGAGIARSADTLARAGDATFGGSSGALQTALSNDAITRGRGSLSAGLSREMFDTAARLSDSDASRRQGASVTNAGLAETALQRQLQAGGQLADVATAEGANTRANEAGVRENIGQQFDIGEQLRQIANQQGVAPIQALMQQIAAFGGLPLDLLKGSTSTGTLTGTTKTKESGAGLGDWLNFFAANAQAAAKAGAGGG